MRYRRPGDVVTSLEVTQHRPESLSTCPHPLSHCHMPKATPHMVACGLCGAPVVDLMAFQEEVGDNFRAHFIAFNKAWLARSSDSAHKYFTAGKTPSINTSGNAGAELPAAPGQETLKVKPATPSGDDIDSRPNASRDTDAAKRSPE